MKTHNGIPVLTKRRKELLERLNNYKTVPGHGLDFKQLTDDELEQYVNLIESMFRLAFKEEANETI